MLVKGSSHTHGTTMRALEEMIRVFEADSVETEVRIAIVGKYTQLCDSYISVSKVGVAVKR